VFSRFAWSYLIPPIVSAPLWSPDAPRPGITVSVVSHGQAEMVQQLLTRLSATHGGWIRRCIVTHNLSATPVEPPAAGWNFAVTELFNSRPIGFGANHNRAFAHCRSDFFCVINPDVALDGADLWESLVRTASIPGTGLAYPQVLNSDGTLQDNEREAVTPAALMRRHLLKRPDERVDWISGAFWLLPSAVYRHLGGFDEGFFMYCEDVDFCLRLRLQGWSLRRADAVVVHDASRRSRRELRHMTWHVRSLLRLWGGQALWRYRSART
jgi:N-acetylglucosaminyl-diphospho-decaprenol L-rhamnosyltransferase